MATCPNGHTTTATDYCDVCGAPMGASDAVDPAVAAEKLQAGEATPVTVGGTQPGTADAPASSGAAVKSCPNCHAANPESALFCEACGYDFTTGSLPRMSNNAPEGSHPQAKPAAPADAGKSVSTAPASGANPLDLEPLDAPPVDAPVAPTPVPVPDVPAPDVPAPDVPAPEAEPVLPASAGASVWAQDADATQVAPVTPVPAPAAPATEPEPAEPTPEPAAPSPEPDAPTTEPAAPAAPTASDTPLGKAEWVAEIWIDPDWYAGQDSPDQLPSPGLPRVVGLRKKASLIGRPSKSRGITPDLDCEPDTGVSRRHAELSTDGTRWWVEDLGSSNGTFVGQAGAPLPTDPIKGRAELGEDARVYVGSWTRIVVRKASPDEADL